MPYATPRNQTPRVARLLRGLLCLCSVVVSWVVLEAGPARAATSLRSAPRTCCAGKVCGCVTHACPCVTRAPVGDPLPAPDPGQTVSTSQSLSFTVDAVRLPAAPAGAASRARCAALRTTNNLRRTTLLDLLGPYRI